MGNYNPHAPFILGNEWAAIRAPGLQPNDITERGYTTSIGSSAAVVTGAFYVKTPPPAATAGVGELIAVYPAGFEDQTGPIRQVTINCDGVLVTGANVTGNPSVTLSTMLDPSDNERITIGIPPGGALQTLGLSFDVASYSNELNGKRILNVEFLYTAYGVASDLAEFDISLARQSNAATSSIVFGVPTGPTTATGGTEINSVSFGEINAFHISTISASAPSEPYGYPWRYTELALLDASATPLNQKLQVLIQSSTNYDGPITIGYGALRVTYCEEQRVAYGALRVNATPPKSFYEGYHYIPLKTPAYALSATLTPGQYSVVVSHVETSYGTTPIPPVLNALQELYEIPSLTGIQVNRSLTPSATFTREYVDVIPTLTLHTTAAIVTGSHPYGVQIQAPVYTGINVTQELELRNAPAVAANFAQVRFYARTTENATSGSLTITMVAQPAATATITVAEFNELPEIVDGWKEVTLRFGTAASLGVAAGVEDFTWTSTNTAAGQWQIMGEQVPALATPQSPNAATYLAPFGAADRLVWKEPNDTASGADLSADVALLLSQDPPTVSGFAITGGVQTVAAVGLNCGTPNGCIPTGISYNHVRWTPLPVSSMQATGFGYYELDRYDAVDAAWQTIMTASSVYVSGFADYEARVGQQSWYRLRSRNVMDFAGAYVTGSATIPAPGVQITGDGNSVLIFTTNVGPTGNLAYTMTWDSRPIESFVFPEADTVQLQRMFGKNFMTAFRPLERGGERFQRTLLVNAAAIALPSLANFRGLRNLAWADVPYICVRDELGNRWFATVLVPSGDVQVDRQLYLAQIEVVETNDAPYAVDPSL